MYTLKNNTGKNFSALTQLIEKFFPFAQKKVGFNKPVSVQLQSDQQNAQSPFGKTAHYEPESSTIVLYTDGRHPKDIMRSLSHELVHHHQNCNGKFENSGATEEGYAQKDPHLREMEKDAFLRGNMVFRDWCDLMQTNGLEETNYKGIKGDNLMNEKTIRELVQKALQTALSKKNILEDTETPLESTEDVSEEEEDLKEGGAADRPENKDKHVADSGRGKRVHLEEEEELPGEEEEDLDEGGAADRPENKDKHVADPGRGKRVKVNEGKKPTKQWWEDSLYNKLLKEYTKK